MHPLWLLLALISAADPAPAPQPAVGLSGILACRAIAAPQERLACFDAQAGVLADAQAKRSIVVLDREAVRKTRRSLFGFDNPSINIFGAPQSRQEADEEREIDATVKAVSRDRDGRWLLTMDDGAQWQQTDDQPVALPPHRGSKVLLRRAALGSYFMRVDGQPGVKAHRVD